MATRTGREAVRPSASTDRKTRDSPAPSAPASPASQYSANTLGSQEVRREEVTVDEADQLLPPPAYSAAVSGTDLPPASGPSNPFMHSEYGTLPRQPAGVGWEPIGNNNAGQPPQRVVYGEEAIPVWLRKKRRANCGRFCKFCTLIAIVVLVVVALMMAGFIASHDKSSNGGSHDSGDRKGPVKLPPGGSSPFDGIRPPSNCAKPTMVEWSHYEFNDRTSFTFTEGDEVEDFRQYPRVSGKIRVVPGDEDQSADLKVNIALGTYHASAFDYVTIKKHRSGLDITTENYLDDSTPRRCLMISATIQVRRGVSLDFMKLASHHLSLEIEGGVNLAIENTLTIDLTAGSLTVNESEGLKPRHTHIHVVAGSVSGIYPLEDVLLFDVEAGSIDVDIDPKEEHKDKPAPAELTIHSRAGRVAVDFPELAEDIPDRDYQIDVRSREGSVEGTFIHGNKTSISTDAGSMKVNIQPLNADRYPTSLTTSCSAGSSRVNVLSPLRDSGAIRRLTSSHTSNTGSVKVVYPSEWEGSMTVESDTGSAKVEGKDVEIVEKRKGLLSRYIKAKKGHGDSEIKVRSTLGGAHVIVGG